MIGINYLKTTEYRKQPEKEMTSILDNYGVSLRGFTGGSEEQAGKRSPR